MRPTLRVLQNVSAAARQHTLGFIGLGQMGQHMASNLYSKSLAAQNTPSLKLVVCDANEAAAGAFANAFAQQFPHAPPIQVVTTPAE